MERLRVALIGAWGHTDSVLQEIDTFGGVDIVGMAKVLPEDDFTEFHPYPCIKTAPVFHDYRQMLDRLRPQVAVISTRLDLIAPVAIDAANAGCHLVCEKPLALTHAHLADLAQAVRKNSVLCLPMIGNRTHPGLIAARQACESGRLGKIALANARKSYKWGQRPDWFGRRDLYGGSIGWVGIHGLDFIYTATGQSFTSVAAMQSNCFHPERPQCEDNAALVLGLSGGGHASLSIDMLRPRAAATHGNDWLRLVGSRGVLEADMARKRVTLTTDDAPEQELPLGETAPYFSEFFDRIRRGVKDIPPDMTKGFFLTHVALCARDAADQQKVVVIPPLPW